MKIDLISPPFRGHLYPLLGIALELESSHDVRVLSTPGVVAEITACGLKAHALLDASTEVELEAISSPGHTIGNDPRRLLAQFRATLDVQLIARDALAALYSNPDQRPDLVISDFTLPVTGPVLQPHGIPWWTSLPSPCVLESRRGPPAYFGGLMPGKGVLGQFRDAAGRKLVRLFKRTIARLEKRRLSALGLHYVYRANGCETVYSPDRILALGLESLEFGGDWPDQVSFVGPRLITPPTDTPAPRFKEGKQHVLVTCGTHLTHQRDVFVQAACALAKALPDVEVHVSAGQVPDQVTDQVLESESARSDATNSMENHTHPPNLTRLTWVSYTEHVHRYDVVVHHGGAGILWHCLVAAVPAVVLPVDYDQPDNAARLVHAGLALQARSGQELSPLVEQLLRDSECQERCAAIAGNLDKGALKTPILALVDQLLSSR